MEFNLRRKNLSYIERISCFQSTEFILLLTVVQTPSLEKKLKKLKQGQEIFLKELESAKETMKNEFLVMHNSIHNLYSPITGVTMSNTVKEDEQRNKLITRAHKIKEMQLFASNATVLTDSLMYLSTSLSMFTIHARISIHLPELPTATLANELKSLHE